MPRFFVLFESSYGLSLFDCHSLNEISVSNNNYQKQFIQFNLFAKEVHLISFSRFPNPDSSLDTMTCINEGRISEFMKDFLSTVLPKQSSKHKTGILLGVSEKKLANSIKSELGCECIADSNVNEVLRGIRMHFLKFLDTTTLDDVRIAETALSHGYSDLKVHHNKFGNDNMISNAIQLLTKIDKDLVSLNKKLNEWYSVFYPELSILVQDPLEYTKIVMSVSLQKVTSDDLQDILKDGQLSEKVVNSLSRTIGQPMEEADVSRIVLLAKRILSMYEYRQNLQTYLDEKMHTVSPNVTSILGTNEGAKLIASAGSLMDLAKVPSSSIKLLGIDSRIFPKMTPKGTRDLSNKLSIAARVDAFSETNRSGEYGKMLKDVLKGEIKDEMVVLAQKARELDNKIN